MGEQLFAIVSGPRRTFVRPVYCSGIRSRHWQQALAATAATRPTRTLTETAINSQRRREEDLMALTKKQQQILDAIVFLIRRGGPPTVREVGNLVGLRSPATVSKHLNALKESGLITINGKSRGIRIANQELLNSLLEENDSETEEAASSESGLTGNIIQTHFRSIAGEGSEGLPIVGAIAAGHPIAAREVDFTDSCDGSHPHLAIDPHMFSGSGDLVAMKIEGDSMIDAGILEGDYVILRRQETVENGEIAAIFIEGEGTLKRLYWDSEVDSNELHSIRLEAENQNFDSMTITEENRKGVVVFGKYVGLVRGELRVL